MIFKTITSSVDESRQTLALFNKDWETYKRNWQNANGVSGKLGSIFTPANAITKSDIEAIKAYNYQIDSCVTSQTAFNRTMLNASPAAQNLVASYNGGKVSAQDMATAQNAAKASTIGLTIAQTALNAAIGMGIGLLISLVVKEIDTLVHANEEAIEKAEELRRKYEEFKSTNESNVTTLNGLKKEFEELSKGVSQYGDNISLTTEQYERYKEIIQQIIGMSPSLAEGYGTENGYIADKNGLLERAIKLQEQEYRNELRKITNLDNLKTSMSGYIAEYKKAFNGGLVTDDMSAIVTREYTDLQNAIYDVFNTNNRSDFSLENMIKQIMNSIGIEDIETETAKYYNKYGYFQSQDFWIDYTDVIAQNIQAITNSLNADIVGLDDTVFDQNIEKVDSAAQSYLDMKDAISMANESIQRDLGYIAEYADGYSNLSTEQQKFTNEFLKCYNISDIMSESYNPFNQGWKFDEDKMASVKSQITKFVETLSQDETTKTALADLYAVPTDEQSISEFVEQFRNALEDINAYCQENGIAIPIAITNSEQSINDLETQYQRAIDYAKDKFDGYDPTAFFKEHSINTQEEIDAWQDIAQGARDAAEAENEYLNPPREPTTFSTQLTQSKDSFDKFQSSVKSASEAYGKLLSGDYSPTDLLYSIQAINKAAFDMGESINWEEIGSLDELSNKIEEISKTYADSVLSGAGIDANSDFNQMLANIIQESYKSQAALSSLNAQIDSLQSAYGDLSDVIETYNKHGYITFDQLQALLSMEPQYLSWLIDENGQLQLNHGALTALANQRLNDAEAQAVQQAITELGQLALQDERIAIEDNAQAFSNAVNDLAVYNDELANTIGEASVASSVIRDLNAAISGAESQGASDVQIDTVLDNLNTKLQLIRNTRLNLGKSLGNIVGGKSSSSSSGSPSSTDDYEEQLNFFERRVEVLDDAVSLLKANLENLTGSFAKNQLLDQNSNILEERMRNYSDAVKMYQKKAQESLSNLDLETQKKIINGSVSLTDYIGEGNETIIEAMNDYKGWADKVADCTEELANLHAQLRQLELDKFNHIVQDFTDQFDLRDNAKGLIDKQISLFEEAGQLVGKAFYEEQIGQTQKQLSLLENEKAQLVSQLNSALGSGRIQKGTEEWLEMVNALSGVDGNILDCKKSIEQFNNAIQGLHWEVFDRVQGTFGNISDEISNLLDLMKNSEVATPDNQWTDEGLTQLGLYAQQYELATYQVSQYADEIDRLNADYLIGKYSATEYADKLADLNSAQWKAVNAAESAKDSILDLNEARVSVVADGIQKEIDAYKELIDSQIEALDAEKDLHEYQNSIAEKSGNIAKLERQLAAMQNDNTAATVAKRKQLEEQLAEARANLDETQYEHSVASQKESLNQQYENYENARNQEIESLEESLKDRENIIAVSMESVKQNTQIIAGQITEIANQHGIKVSSALTNSWASGENAIASYGEVLSQGTSAFIGNIMAVESQIYQLQADADITAVSLANMFGTNADNLVNQLNSSYFAEVNLLNMTNALQSSLISTLQGEYNVSNILNSLNAITNAARIAKGALETPLQPISSPTKPDETAKSLPGMTAAIAAGNGGILRKYASGTHNITKRQLAITNESGQEFIYRAKDGSILTRLQPGDKVFNNAAVERLYQLGQGLVPADITPHMEIPQLNNIKKAEGTVNMNYDHLIEINGDVNDTNHFIKQISTVAEQAITNAVKTAEKTRKYGMF